MKELKGSSVVSSTAPSVSKRFVNALGHNFHLHKGEIYEYVPQTDETQMKFMSMYRKWDQNPRNHVAMNDTIRSCTENTRVIM